MSIVYFSVCLCFIPFLSLISYNFQNIGLLSLVRFIPMHFILYDAIVRGFFFLIFLSDSLLSVYKNITDFCILTLYLANLVKSYIVRNYFWWCLQDFLSIASCQLQTVIALPLQLDRLCLILIDHCAQDFRQHLE